MSRARLQRDPEVEGSKPIVFVQIFSQNKKEIKTDVLVITEQNELLKTAITLSP